MIAPARRAAFGILHQIATTDAHSDELLRTPAVDALSPQDRNLTTTLVLGTLRWQLALDERIRPLLSRPDMQLAPETATALRLGAYQLLHLDRVPAHAVLNDAVEIIKQSSQRGAAGMVNAVLRKITQQPRRTLPAQFRSARELASTLAHPAWMVERWARRYGIAAAEAICRWDQEPAGATVRLSGGTADPAGLELGPGAFLANARRVSGGDISRADAFHSGEIRIQDEASQLVAEIAAASAREASMVLDTCAAPGGKTAVLAERLPQSTILAVDASRRRLDALRAAMEPDHRTLRFQAADAARLRLEPIYGLILCDVPCTGTGTIARNPEIRLRIEAADLPRQHARQIAILRAALQGLAPEGRLVYSTCSLESEENDAVVEEILRAFPNLRVVPIGPILDQLTTEGIVTAEGRERLSTALQGESLRTLPGIHPCDGFFAAVLARD